MGGVRTRSRKLCIYSFVSCLARSFVGVAIRNAHRKLRHTHDDGQKCCIIKAVGTLLCRSLDSPKSKTSHRRNVINYNSMSILIRLQLLVNRWLFRYRNLSVGRHQNQSNLYEKINHHVSPSSPLVCKNEWLKLNVMRTCQNTHCLTT